MATSTFRKTSEKIYVAKLTKVLRGFKNTQRKLQASANLLHGSDSHQQYMWGVSRIRFWECSSGQAAFLKSTGLGSHSVPQRFEKPLNTVSLPPLQDVPEERKTATRKR